MSEPVVGLKLLRENKGLTQLQVAQRIGTDVQTYAAWECGYHKPLKRFRIELAKLFKVEISEINALFGGRHLSVCGNIEVPEYIQAYALKNLMSRLLSIVDAGTYSNQCEQFTRILEEYDAMTEPENVVHQSTRRDAIRNLATLPFVGYPLYLAKQTTIIPSTRYEPFIQLCGASLVACEELSRIGDANDIAIAFECVSRYLVELDVIIQDSSKYREPALELAAHCAILKKSLGVHHLGNGACLSFAQDAVIRSDASGIIGYRLSARSKLAWFYLDVNRIHLALQVAKEALLILKQHKGILPVGIRGGVFSTLAIMEARNEIDPDTALKKASEQGPDSEIQYLMSYTKVNLLQEKALAYGYVGKTDEAMEACTEIVDPITLQPTTRFQGILTERDRLLVVEGMARVSLEGLARDRDNAIHFWKHAIEGAKAIGSESRYDRLTQMYDLMKVAFSGEKQVLDLRDHFRQR